MRRIVFSILVFIGCVGGLFAAEVTRDKRDISVVPAFYSGSEDFDVSYMDNQLIKVFKDLGRFSVIGCQFQFTSMSDLESFMTKIQEMKKKAILSDEKYIDAQFGVVMIPKAEMERLSKSYFIVIPTITTIKTSYETVQILSKSVDVYVTKLAVTIRFIDGEGRLLDAYSYDNVVPAREGESEAQSFKRAVEVSLADLPMFLRKLPPFIQKSTILRLGFGVALVDLGQDAGIKPGYEYVIKGGMVDDLGMEIAGSSGLIRISQVGTTNSRGTILLGNPQIGAQLVEAPLTTFVNTPIVALRAVPFVDFYLPMASASPMTLLKNGFSSQFSTYTGTTLGIGAAAGVELGYDLSAEVKISYLMGKSAADFIRANTSYTLLLNVPVLFEIGGGWEYYMGPLSFQLGLDVGVTAFAYASSGVFNFGVADLIAKAKCGVNFQFSQNVKLRAAAGYVMDLPFNAYNGSSSFTGSGTSGVILPWTPYIGGLAGSVEAVFRF